ncbi:DUF4435 domain-containing protein [Campylobacter canadensis]|nr:DUF4435 domain-containing protein [Campylobacter canadensis]MBZ7998552.1 DUF4435 domain-containing protein [Campylobacter canadensis]
MKKNKCEIKKNKNVIFQEIIANKSKVDIFVLLEGDDDIKYYSQIINNMLIDYNSGDTKNIRYYICKGKKDVLSLVEKIQKSTGLDLNKRIMSFVDRDFDYELNLEHTYITESYSIENYYFSNQAINKTVKYLLKIDDSEFDSKRIKNMVGKIIKERDKALEDIVFINAVYCLQMSKSLPSDPKPNLSKVKEYSQITKIKQDEIKDYIENYVDISNDEINLLIEHMKKNLVYEIRGKYILSLMKKKYEVFFDAFNKDKSRSGSIDILLLQNIIVSFASCADKPKKLINYISRYR